jgi:asparagine synthase (glutamine-hydrolysing)
MCGIAGIIFKSESKHEWAKPVMNGMLDRIAHRGPDDRNIVSTENAILGHVRLSIIDIKNGQQPFLSDDGNYILVFNGEIYNYIELKQILIRKGHQFRTNSDTEVLSNMYIEYKEEMLSYINGMFSFLIYDKEKKTAFASRDHFGIKPFYFFEHEGFFAFASEIKALFEIPLLKASASEKAIHEYLTFQFSLSKETLFKGVKKLEPASYLELERGHITKEQVYWEVNYNIDESKSIEQFGDEVLVAINNSVAIQMRSDVEVGVYLSGGIDSSTIAMLASKHLFDPIHCFTGAFAESSEYDETKYAKHVVTEIGANYHEIYPTHADFPKHFENLMWLMDEPSAGPGLFSQFMVSKLASEKVKVVLGGQGGDEVFGGYSRYNVAYLEQCLKGEIFSTNEEGKHVVSLESMIKNLPSLKNYAPLIKKQFTNGLFEEMDQRYFNLINRSSQSEKYYSQEFLSTRKEEDIFQKYQNIFNSSGSTSLFNKMTSFDLKTFLPSLLHVEDRVSMGNSIESRVPLLDKDIVELVAKIPPTYKFNGGKSKHIFVEAVKNILPEKIVNRTDKMGFPTPINSWLSGPLKEYALDILTSQKAKQRGFLNTSTIEKTLGNQPQFGRDLWGALCLEMWFIQHIDRPL